MIQILLVDDHPSVREGTKLMLEQEGDMNVSIAESGIQAIELLKEQSFDVLLIDLNMPGLNGIDLIKEIFSLDPEAVILIFTGYDIGPHFNPLVQAGISGFVPKTSSKERLITAIRCALNGETVIPTSLFRGLGLEGIEGDSEMRGAINASINDKELTILRSLAQGMSNKEIAAILITSQRTMEYCLTQLFQKLNVKSRKEAVAKAKELGIITSDDFI